MLLTTGWLEARGDFDFAVEVPAQDGAAVVAFGGD